MKSSMLKIWLAHRAASKSAAARCRARMLVERDPLFRRTECACMMVYLRSMHRASTQLRHIAAEGLMA